ncbi:MAG: N-glycosylase/DNA lyase [Nanoarchaeota archaeon]
MEWIHEAYAQRKEEIEERLDQFSHVQGDHLFYELCFCLLTPQSNGRRCDEAVQILRNKDFMHASVPLVPVLKTKTRFHHHKARYLEEMKQTYPFVVQRLQHERDSFALRTWLVEHVRGMGMKEASHFLRNVGYRGLAILDRHILRNLVKCNVLDTLPKTLTEKRYLEIEQLLFSFSKKIGIHADALDLLFWSMETGEVFK